MYKILETISEVAGWIQIVLSPALPAAAIGAAIWYYNPNRTGIVCGVLVALIGLIIGIIWATKKFKTTGTVDFLSSIRATPDLDHLAASETDKNEDGEKK